MNKVERVEDLARMVQQDPKLEAELRADPRRALEQVAAPPLLWDVWIYRTVVGVLGLVAIVAIVGTIMLANTTNGIPDALISLGSAAVGALAGLLAPSPRSG